MLYLRPREVARLKRCRNELVYDAIVSGRLRAAIVTSESGRRRFLIAAGEADRWQPKRRLAEAEAGSGTEKNEPAAASTARVLGQEHEHAPGVE